MRDSAEKGTRYTENGTRVNTATHREPFTLNLSTMYPKKTLPLYPKQLKMNNNDILRRIRFTFDFTDSEMIELFALADFQATRSQISDWLKREDDPAFRELSDNQLAIFLNGFINEKRGKKEGEQPIPENRLNNNIILRKLKIALNLKDDDILDILELVDMPISKHELSAFFRNPNQSQYRLCNDQIFRKFLQGMQKKYLVSP